jgi:hypothetical protein
MLFYLRRLRGQFLRLREWFLRRARSRFLPVRELLLDRLWSRFLRLESSPRPRARFLRFEGPFLRCMSGIPLSDVNRVD